METIKELVAKSAVLGARLIEENPGLTNLTFVFEDFTLDEMREYAETNNSTRPEFRESCNRFTMGVCPTLEVFVHLRSVQLKAKIVYEQAL